MSSLRVLKGEWQVRGDGARGRVRKGRRGGRGMAEKGACVRRKQ